MLYKGMTDYIWKFCRETKETKYFFQFFWVVSEEKSDKYFPIFPAISFFSSLF